MARGLGKGLGSFFPELDQQEEEKVQEIALKECRPNPYQPRKTFQQEAIDELRDSILEYGVLQPVILRKSIKGYEIVVGERRCRAAKAAGLPTIPAVVRELTDSRMMEIALLENLQREDLSPIEEAHAYTSIMNELDLTQEELSKRLGKSRSHIANIVRLLSLPEPVSKLINEGSLTMGHGRALLGLKDKEQILPLVEKIKRDGLNVRQVEYLIVQMNEKSAKKKRKRPTKDVFLQERELKLQDRLGTGVNIQRGKRKGKIEIEFFTNDDLERILQLLDHE
ncbi:plasmid partitioning protein ParB [Pontibacillus halophilus JSM 076056 = DSM 19796]|uniref:Plasmid partitioning protein ParB n=1 Tax=Pontibacillus halophilus JSM 076056 = DSM 19796 TaxID=1385510 RepID=A0A0A5GR11_9BACI|nr:ParB/RepB/Spo0J family partition protein [Pontibacillus halophilus]KGX93683.1 plasmid partitioning protein ParB [Pontibacillus halophilus JSM 076056 = DSM 19796]